MSDSDGKATPVISWEAVHRRRAVAGSLAAAKRATADYAVGAGHDGGTAALSGMLVVFQGWVFLLSAAIPMYTAITM